MSLHISGENLHTKGHLSGMTVPLLRKGAYPRVQKHKMILSRKPSSVISSACSCQAWHFCIMCICDGKRGSKAVQAICSWNKEPTQPTGSAQCYNIIGNHFCQCGVSMWEGSLQYSSHRKPQGGLFSCTGCLLEHFFLCYCKYFCSSFILTHTGSNKPLELCIQMWRWKIVEKDKNNILFSSCMRFTLWKQIHIALVVSRLKTKDSSCNFLAGSGFCHDGWVCFASLCRLDADMNRVFFILYGTSLWSKGTDL